MKTIARWDHLSEFGIIPLTGESCGLGYRTLCDVIAVTVGAMPQANAHGTALKEELRRAIERWTIVLSVQ